MSLAPMAEPRQEPAAAELGGRIFAVGGLAGRANANTIYHNVRDAWTVGADLPVTTDHAWAVFWKGAWGPATEAATGSFATTRPRISGRKSLRPRSCTEA